MMDSSEIKSYNFPRENDENHRNLGQDRCDDNSINTNRKKQWNVTVGNTTC
jgi:hypothetical protein